MQRIITALLQIAKPSYIFTQIIVRNRVKVSIIDETTGQNQAVFTTLIHSNIIYHRMKIGKDYTATYKSKIKGCVRL